MRINLNIYPCSENQLDALFTLSLFRQATSICFGHVYMFQPNPTDSHLKSTTRINCCIYTA